MRGLYSGNQLLAHGALAAGCTFFAGYPITPSSEIYAEMMRLLPSRGGVAVGAPDEITSLSYAIGASLTGRRAMTATSGPGWSLMIESFQYALMTETPVVIAMVQRLGPATGGATQGAQGDVLFVRYAASGGYTVPVFCPVDAVDCYALAGLAFATAERLRTPVVLLSDKDVATTIETIDLTQLPSVAPASDRPAVSGAAHTPYIPYGIAAPADVPAFAPVGGAHKVTVTGSTHNQRGELRKNDPETLALLAHLEAKIADAPDLEFTRLQGTGEADTLLISYGTSARACRAAQRELARCGHRVDLLEVLSLFPLPRQALAAATSGKRRVLVVEENRSGLCAQELEPSYSACEARRVNGVGTPIAPAAIVEAVLA